MKNLIDVSSTIEMLKPHAKAFEGKKILCTGTSGFLGKWVVRTISMLNKEILDNPCKLIAVDLNRPDIEERLEIGDDENISFISHNLSNRFEGFLEGNLDYVIHMAGIASPYHYKLRPLETIDVALEGSRGMLDIAKKYNARYLFCSSSEVYQTADINPTPETYIGAIPSNTSRSCYDVSKLMGETLAHVYADQFSLNTGVVRIFNSMGPGLDERDHRILPRIASAIIRKKKLTVFKNHTLPSRTYCPVANTVAGIFLALINGKCNEIYNIGLDTPELTVVELIEKIENILNLKIDWELVAAPDVYIDEPLRRCPDISKAKLEIGYNPIVQLDEGLKIFFEWAFLNYPLKNIE
jgi:UDP-glucuronate decarboxylase